MKRKIILIIGILINLLIWINSLMPATISSNQSGFFVKLFYPLFDKIISVEKFSYLIRKLAHFTEYLLLGLVFSYVYYLFRVEKKVLITLAHGLLAAVIDEIIQLFTPGRAMLLTDILIDFSGVVSGVLIFSLLIFLTFKK